MTFFWEMTFYGNLRKKSFNFTQDHRGWFHFISGNILQWPRNFQYIGRERQCNVNIVIFLRSFHFAIVRKRYIELFEQFSFVVTQKAVVSKIGRQHAFICSEQEERFYFSAAGTFDIHDLYAIKHRRQKSDLILREAGR